MNRIAKPRLGPLDRIVVFEAPTGSGDAGVLGRHGTLIWRSSRYSSHQRSLVGAGRFVGDGLVCVVYFPGSRAYLPIAESRLLPTGLRDPIELHLGRELEISFDPRDARDAGEPITGTFRAPGRFWNTFAFSSRAIDRPHYRICLALNGGIAQHRFDVPESFPLDRLFLETLLAGLSGEKTWRRIEGPDSRLLT